MKNQPNQTNQNKTLAPFDAFGVPDVIITNGEVMTERAEFSTPEGKAEYLRRARRAFANDRIAQFVITRIGGKVKLYLASI